MRFDNGPEFVAHAVSDWCRFDGADSLFIDPSSPWKNASIESVNGRLRDELLNSWRFDSLLDAQVIIEDWRCDYNANRPHSTHGELTPPSSLYSGPRRTNPSRITTGPQNGPPQTGDNVAARPSMSRRRPPAYVLSGGQHPGIRDAASTSSSPRVASETGKSGKTATRERGVTA